MHELSNFYNDYCLYVFVFFCITKACEKNKNFIDLRG